MRVGRAWSGRRLEMEVEVGAVGLLAVLQRLVGYLLRRGWTEGLLDFEGPFGRCKILG